MGRFVRYAFFLTVWIFVGLIGARMVGAVIEQPNVLERSIRAESVLLEGVWCWRQICPERTRWADLQRLTGERATRVGKGSVYENISYFIVWRVPGMPGGRSQGYSANFAQFNRFVGGVNLTLHQPTLRLGDVILVWGVPRSTIAFWLRGSYFVHVSFPDNRSVLIRSTGNLDPHAEVEELYYFDSFPPYLGLSAASRRNWRGLVWVGE